MPRMDPVKSDAYTDGIETKKKSQTGDFLAEALPL